MFRRVAQEGWNMEDDQFWSIIDRCQDPDPDSQVERLRAQLLQLSPEDIAGFRAAMDRKLIQSYTWPLWAAAYVAKSGCGDDGFEYFRFWLISRGRETFETVLADPDALADIVGDDDPEDGSWLEFEDFGYVALDAWSEKTGRPFEEMPDLLTEEETAALSEPAGEPWDETREDLERICPRLVARFWPDTD
jgi:hypothetical protein